MTSAPPQRGSLGPWGLRDETESSIVYQCGQSLSRSIWKGGGTPFEMGHFTAHLYCGTWLGDITKAQVKDRCEEST